MKLKIGDFTVRNLIISYIILYSIMPIVARLTSNYLTTYFYMVVVVALVILILVLDRPENLNEYLTFLLPFIIYGFLTFFATSSDIVLWGYQTLLFWLPIILGYYFTQDTTRILTSYPKLMIFAIVVTMITTIIGCIQNPNAARELATISDSQGAAAVSYDMKNIGGYSFIYSMVLLYPVLILAYKTGKIRLLPTMLIAIAILFTTIYSEYTTALLLFILNSFLFLTKRNLSVRGIFFISIFAILFLLIFPNVITDFLNWLSGAVESKTMSTRLDALSGGKAGLESSEDNRLELYTISLNRFFQYPLFGELFESRKTNGGHSFILDSFASYGLLGGSLMFFMYKRIFTRFFLPFKNKIGFGYIVWVFIQAIILSFINTGMWLNVLCLFVPLLLYWIYGTEEIKNEDTVDSQLASGSAG